MNTPFDPHATDPSLTPEERDLAQRLSRLGGQREPAPALDARILAAAHDAVQASASASKQRRTRRRWPVALGVAASLTLAVGIAWRLRPLPDADIVYSEAPAAASVPAQAEEAFVKSEASGPDQANEADDDAFVQRAEAVTPEQPEPARPAERKAVADATPAQAKEKVEAGFVAEPDEPAIVFDEPSAVDTPAPVAGRSQFSPPAAAPQAPPPPPAPAPAAAPASAAPSATAAGAAAATKQREARQERARGDVRASDAAAEAEAASALDRIEATGSRIQQFENQPLEDQPLDDQPPVSADSPQVQQAWLQRIRELIVHGKLDEARASLAEYHRRYPGQPLPDDLRALEQ